MTLFRRRTSLAAMAAVLLGGCGGLLPKPQTVPTLLALDDAAWAAAVPSSAFSTGSSGSTGRTGSSGSAVIVVGAPRAAAGYDTRNIVFVRRAHEIEYFALHQWVDTPAQMLAPLMVRALQRSGAFRAVVPAPAGANAELLLETELVRLQQDFTQVPSRVRLTLRALLIDIATRRVLATRDFDLSSVAPSEDAYGGAVAANAAVQQLMVALAAFCAEAPAR